MRQRKHPEYYYAMRDDIIVLMEDQSGKPFDASNFRTQFRKVAAKHKVPATSYLAHFNIIRRMVAKKLPRMKPRQDALV